MRQVEFGANSSPSELAVVTMIIVSVRHLGFAFAALSRLCFVFLNVYCQRRTHLWFSVRNWNPDNSLMISRSHYNLNEGENC